MAAREISSAEVEVQKKKKSGSFPLRLFFSGLKQYNTGWIFSDSGCGCFKRKAFVRKGEFIMTEAKDASKEKCNGGVPENMPIPYRQEVFRKLIHLSSLWIPAVIYLYQGQKILLVYFFLTLLILNLLCEFAYSCQVPVIREVYSFFFGRMLRNKQVKRGQWVVSGAPPVFAAAALACLLFRPYFAAIGMVVMLTADTAAALIGRRFGRHACVNHKSVEGVAAFIVTGLVFSLLILWGSGIFSWKLGLGAVLGTVLAAGAELFEKQLHVDDNLSIPVIMGAVLTLF